MFGKKKKVNAAVDGQPAEATVENKEENKEEKNMKKVSLKKVLGIAAGAAAVIGTGAALFLRSRKGLDSEFESCESAEDFTDFADDPAAADSLDL